MTISIQDHNGTSYELPNIFDVDHPLGIRITVFGADGQKRNRVQSIDFNKRQAYVTCEDENGNAYLEGDQTEVAREYVDTTGWSLQYTGPYGNGPLVRI